METSTQPDTRYVERLTAPWWLWLGGGIFGVILAAEVHLGYDNLRAWVPYVLVLSLVAAGLLWVGKTSIRVTPSDLYVGDAVLPREVIHRADVVKRGDKRTALGVELSAWAFVVHRPWIPTAVRITLDDPADATPYWIVSTRHPEELIRNLCK